MRVHVNTARPMSPLKTTNFADGDCLMPQKSNTAAVTLMIGFLFCSGSRPITAQGPSPEQPDKYTWLEDINGEKPMEWVKA